MWVKSLLESAGVRGPDEIFVYTNGKKRGKKSPIERSVDEGFVYCPVL